MKLFGAPEDAVRFAERLEGRRGRLLHQRPTGRVAVTRVELPWSFEDAFHEIVHDERRAAEEAAGAGRVVNAEGDLVPFPFAQGADGNLVAMDRVASAPVVRRESAARADLPAVHPDFVRAREIANVDAHGFLE